MNLTKACPQVLGDQIARNQGPAQGFRAGGSGMPVGKSELFLAQDHPKMVVVKEGKWKGTMRGQCEKGLSMQKKEKRRPKLGKGRRHGQRCRAKGRRERPASLWL